MSYDARDIFLRIKSMLPARWFGEETPVLDQVLNSLAAGWASVQNLLDYARAQTRISTSFEGWLDLTAEDYFGSRLRRRRSEDDRRFRRRIVFELRRERCTRLALRDALYFLTEREPFLFEPAHPFDTGCYGLSAANGHGVAGYGVAGGWGNLSLPFQVFVRVQRSPVPGVAMINGWRETAGAYGAGQSSYISTDATDASVTDDEIYECIRRTLPIGCIAWVAIDA